MSAHLITNETIARIEIKSPIRKATAKKEARYDRSGVLATPAPGGHVVIHATDGHQATMTFAKGNIDKPRMIPGEILPKTANGDTLAFDGEWRAGSGKICIESQVGAESFPPLMDFTPELSAEQSRVVSLDVDVLAKAAAAFGTTKLTLFISDNPKRPIGVMPAKASDGEAVRGVGVVMPFGSHNDVQAYNAIRDEIKAAQRATAEAEPATA